MTACIPASPVNLSQEQQGMTPTLRHFDSCCQLGLSPYEAASHVHNIAPHMPVWKITDHSCEDLISASQKWLDQVLIARKRFAT